MAAAVAKGEVSAVELTRACIERIDSSQLNAVVVRDFDRAAVTAELADAARARGDSLGPLHGVPVTLKESYDVSGLPTTWGLPQYKDSQADDDAVLVQRLRAAGAIVLGKTNVPVMLGDYQAANPIYGRTNNPWDPARSPGGSSGGSAAAVAAGLTGLGHGSDFGGSIRNPAALCGVYGHKPTWGIVPMRGHAPPSARPRPEVGPDLAVVGPIARAAEDLALSLRIVAGPDRLASTGWRLDLPLPRRTSLTGLRVAVWADDPLSPVEHEISERVLAVAATLAEAGAVVSHDARPACALAHCRQTFVGLSQAFSGALMPAEAYAATRRRVDGSTPTTTPRWPPRCGR